MCEKTIEQQIKEEVLKRLNSELDDVRLREASIKKKIDDVNTKGIELDCTTYATMLKEAGGDTDLLAKGYAKLITDGVLFLDYFKPLSPNGEMFGWTNPNGF